MKKVEAIFISDAHLGSRGCNAEELLSTLKQYEVEHLFIVGDFIDGWILKKRHYWTQEFTNVIRKILSYSKGGTKVVYVTGNHDDFLRSYTPMAFSENIKIVDEYIWNDYYIIHGDQFDGIVKMKWLGVLGSWGYEAAIWIDRLLKKLGNKKSLSKFLKNNIKNAIKFVTNFEKQVAYQAKIKSCKGVVTGHIHTPANHQVDGIHYLNCGDWIENNSYIIYNKGKFTVNYHRSL
jgi:UDP-2,3-diacylglucosamine pyrophosphatase LpxH